MRLKITRSSEGGERWSSSTKPKSASKRGGSGVDCICTRAGEGMLRTGMRLWPHEKCRGKGEARRVPSLYHGCYNSRRCCKTFTKK